MHSSMYRVCTVKELMLMLMMRLKSEVEQPYTCKSQENL